MTNELAVPWYVINVSSEPLFSSSRPFSKPFGRELSKTGLKRIPILLNSGEKLNTHTHIRRLPCMRSCSQLAALGGEGLKGVELVRPYEL